MTSDMVGITHTHTTIASYDRSLLFSLFLFSLMSPVCVGPFSHTFDGLFIPQAIKQREEKERETATPTTHKKRKAKAEEKQASSPLSQWKHEHASLEVRICALLYACVLLTPSFSLSHAQATETVYLQSQTVCVYAQMLDYIISKHSLPFTAQEREFIKHCINPSSCPVRRGREFTKHCINPSSCPVGERLIVMKRL